MGLFHYKKDADPQWHNADVVERGGYVYTLSEKFSTLHATNRQSDAVLSAFDYAGKKVIDIGCGDGKYTFELWQKGHPAELIGIDPAEEAVKVAQKKYGTAGLSFYDYNAYHIPYPDGYFDIAVVRGVIHHLDKPDQGVRECVRVAKKLVLTDPSGYNLGVKIIEKVSPYHRAHKEMSYFPYQYRRWLVEAGAKVTKDYYIILVPFFFPDVLAKILAKLEPMFERSRILSSMCCGTYVRIAENQKYSENK